MAADPSLSQEFRFLATALRPPSQAGAAEALAQAAERLADWPRLLRLALRHRVIPGLAAALDRARVIPPPEVAATLRSAASAAAFDELGLAATLRRLLAVFRDQGIPVGVLKGVPLSLALHGRLGLRTSRDIDLLVAPDAAARACALIEAQGFVRRGPVDPETIRRRKDVELVNPSTGETIELHWRLLDNPHLLPLPEPVPLVWKNFPFALDCLVLPDRLNLLYLACHGAQHGWSRLKWLADLAVLLDGLGPEGRAAHYADTAVADGRRALGQALLLCDVLFGMTAPELVMAEARRDWRLRALRRIALASMTAGDDREMESVRFGTTAKNLSHYLLRTAPAYMLAEARFDIADFSAAAPGSRWHRLGPVGRISNWLARHMLGR